MALLVAAQKVCFELGRTVLPAHYNYQVRLMKGFEFEVYTPNSKARLGVAALMPRTRVTVLHGIDLLTKELHGGMAASLTRLLDRVDAAAMCGGWDSIRRPQLPPMSRIRPTSTRTWILKNFERSANTAFTAD